MKTLNKIYANVLNSFIAEFGYEPTNIAFHYGLFIADGFVCSLNDRGNIKKTHGLAWRKN
jgi:hypothetical protein